MQITPIDLLTRFVALAMAIVLAVAPTPGLAPVNTVIASPAEDEEQEAAKVVSVAVRARHVVQPRLSSAQQRRFESRIHALSDAAAARPHFPAPFGDAHMPRLRC